MMCHNYRAGTLLCTIFKILANILYVKLVPYAEEITKYQGGFQRGKSTFDQLFTTRHIMEKCCDENKDVHRLLIFKQHMTLNGGRKYGVKCINQVSPPETVNMCRILNNEIRATVKIGKYLSSEFKVNKGVRQGDAIAPLLFNGVLEIAIRRSKQIHGQPYLTNAVKLWHTLIMWLLWEEYYTMSKKYLHHWSNKQIRWIQNLKKDKIYNSIMKALTMKMSM